MRALIIIDMQQGMAGAAAGAPRRADDVHWMTLSNLDGEYAAIVDTAGLLATFEE